MLAAVLLRELLRGCTVAAIALLLPLVSWGADRVALVIGNSAYLQSPLQNPRNDARAMAVLLREAGFSVEMRLDASREQMVQAIDTFGREISRPEVNLAIFYYAGHGIQQDWRNYLVPVSAKITTSADVASQAVDIGSLLAGMKQARGRNFLVVLDACRDDPFAGAYKAPNKGLSQFDAPGGSLLAYATAPGNVAEDGEGSNGLYTGSLLRELAVRGARLEDAFKRVRLNVRLASRGAQIPWESTSLEDDIFLFPTYRKDLSEAEKDQFLDQEIAAWNAVRNSHDPNRLADFIRRYPSGGVSELAQYRFNRLLLAIGEGESQRLAAQAVQATQPALPVGLPSKATPAPALAGQAAPAPRPLAPTPYSKGYAELQRDLRTGDSFQFTVTDQFAGRLTKTLVLEVTQVDRDADRVVYNEGEFVSDLMGNIVNNRLGLFSTPRQFYPSDLFVGKHWETRFRQSRPNGDKYTFQYKLRVEARETISVPAGTFDAFRIVAQGMNMERGARLERVIWVAPGVDVDVAQEYRVRQRNGQMETQERTELVSLTRAPR